MEWFEPGFEGIKNDHADFGNRVLREIRPVEHQAKKKKPHLPFSRPLLNINSVVTSKSLCMRKKIEKGNTICLPRKLLMASEMHRQESIHEYIHTTFFQPEVQKRDRRYLLTELLMAPAEAEQICDVPDLSSIATPKVRRSDRMDALRELVMSPAEEEQLMDFSDSSTTAWD